MNFAIRIRALKRRIEKRKVDIPKDEYEFCKALLEGRITVHDLDRRNPDHTSWLATLSAVLAMRLSAGRTYKDGPLP